jgi:hypothetical protein
MKDHPDFKDLEEFKGLKTLFFEAEVILNYNQMFLKDLDARISDWSQEQVLGDIMIKVVRLQTEIIFGDYYIEIIR